MDGEAKALQASVHQTIADCGGDAVEAVRVLIVAYTQLAADHENLKAEIARLAAAASPGYMRRKVRHAGGEPAA